MLRLYSLTDAGRKVWDAQSDRVPLDYRRVLGLVGVETDPRNLGARLGWSQAAVEEILKELEKARLVKSIGAGADDDELDFTGSLDLEELRAARQKR